MSPTPEEIKASVHEAELAKGSDPRVAEGRSKAAEARARHGYPIEPQEAWPIKLQTESGKAPTATASAAAPTPVASAAGSQAPKTATGQGPAADEVSGAGESPSSPTTSAAATVAPTTTASAAGSQAPKTATGLDPAADEVSGAGESPEGLATTVPPVAAGPSVSRVAAVQIDPAFEPEVGELIEPRDVLISHYAGLRVRDSRLPGWLVLLIVLIPMWAILYLAVLGGDDVNRKTTGCVVKHDRTLVCFQPETSSP